MTEILCIILIVAAIALVALVLFQSGKSHGLSGTIAGGAETFFGKSQSKTRDKMLNKITTIVAICFVAILLVIYIAQPDIYSVDVPGLSLGNSELYEAPDTSKDTTADTSADTSADTDADTSADTDADTGDADTDASTGDDTTASNPQ